MIVQSVIDFIRDVLVNWLVGINGLIDLGSAQGAAAGFGGAALAVSRILALFLDSAFWGGFVALFVTFLAVWAITALIAIVGRRAAGGPSPMSGPCFR